MFKRSFLLLLALMMVLVLVIAGCGEKEEALGTGALVDEVVYSLEESPAAAVSKLKSGESDIYANSVTDPDLFDEILASDEILYEYNYGSYRELSFNTWGPTFEDGRFNPFHIPEIREAFNWLIDRNYIVEEYLGGLGAAKYTVLGTTFPDAAIRYPHIVKEIEEHYAHNPEKAKEIVTQKMEEANCELVDGKWHYNGEKIEIKMLIRSDSPPNPAAGNYVADLVEDVLGFEVERMERTGTDASPIWYGAHPKEGLMHIYTGGWISSAIPRDQGSIFDQMYTHRVMASPLWTVLEEDLKDFPEFDEASRKLRFKEFTNMEEREELFKTALWEGMKFSPRIWLVDVAGANPYRSDVKVACDVAGGIGDPSWVFTAHRHKDGKPVPTELLRVELPNMLVEPWNPVEGSSWSYDMYFTRRAVGGAGTIPDPRDGLYWPLRIEKAEVVVEEGLPVVKTHDWVTLEFASDIEVPLDAWADWDPEEQRFVTVEERFGEEGTTALRKTVVHYPDNLYETPLHDGSKLSLGDFILAMIMTFDRGKEASPVFDKAEQAGLEAWLDTFKGVKIVSEDPLVIETYSDMWYMDAELNASDPTDTWYPQYGTYAWSGYWHMIALGWMAEAEKSLAFSQDKSDDLGVEQMDYTKGPSLPILEECLEKAIADNFIPYEPVLGEYISAEEATERWSNLKAFYEEWGHFWVGTGPYIIKSVHPVEKQVVLTRFADYPDPADRFFFFLEDLAIAE
ncbi:MAG TPA: ABC transporter substrate-binding protein [Bacillota bacterium]|jgi:peptide/nickel transport system substrate-binding protein|nr:ABC transporter substrate-binding protein [Bacillota bacterium]HPZ11448.1 ABC transporter substrate-binding protein [Bacillota bacterium]HQE10515.1 ABC transporter substrate-binding protein [Bacillota bacterium]